MSINYETSWIEVERLFDSGDTDAAFNSARTLLQVLKTKDQRQAIECMAAASASRVLMKLSPMVNARFAKTHPERILAERRVNADAECGMSPDTALNVVQSQWGEAVRRAFKNDQQNDTKSIDTVNRSMPDSTGT